MFISSEKFRNLHQSHEWLKKDHERLEKKFYELRGLVDSLADDLGYKYEHEHTVGPRYIKPKRIPKKG